MRTVKNMEDLERIRNREAKKLEKRLSDKGTGNAEILFGMATCGIAAGAQDAYDAIENELLKMKIKNVDLVKVGCIGHCHSEPLIQVNLPGRDPVLYGNVDEETAVKILTEHVINGKELDRGIIEPGFKRA